MKIQNVSETQFKLAYEQWEQGGLGCCLLYYISENGVYIALDNSSNECYIEEFVDEASCIAYLNQVDLELFDYIDERYRLQSNVYNVSIEERLSRTISIVARDEDEAYHLTKKLYYEEDVILDSSDFVDSDIYVLEL